MNKKAKSEKKRVLIFSIRNNKKPYEIAKKNTLT